MSNCQNFPDRQNQTASATCQKTLLNDPAVLSADAENDLNGQESPSVFCRVVLVPEYLRTGSAIYLERVKFHTEKHRKTVTFVTDDGIFVSVLQLMNSVTGWIAASPYDVAHPLINRLGLKAKLYDGTTTDNVHHIAGAVWLPD